MDTLVLSASYEPVQRISWQRAVTLMFSGKVEVVEEYEDRTVRSVTFEIRMPSVVRFLRRLRFRHRKPRFTRDNLLSRDGHRCQYCARGVSRAEATYDHVLPRAQGGRTTWENVVIACVRCNQKKGGRTPEQAGMKLLSVPKRPHHLPDPIRVTLAYQKGMPPSWRAWLLDLTYWHGELERG